MGVIWPGIAAHCVWIICKWCILTMWGQKPKICQCYSLHELSGPYHPDINPRQPNHAVSELCNRLGLTKGCMPFVVNNSWYVNTKYIVQIMLQSQAGRVLYFWSFKDCNCPTRNNLLFCKPHSVTYSIADVNGQMDTSRALRPTKES